MSAYSVAEQIQTLKGHICCYTEEEIDALVDAIRAELREQIAAEIEADPKRTFMAGRAETSLTSHELAIWSGMRRAARVARGEMS